MIRIDDVVEQYLAHHPEGDAQLIERAYVFANMMHEYQKRNSGLPYITHPLNVASKIGRAHV